jgi:hypothetical protein
MLQDARPVRLAVAALALGLAVGIVPGVPAEPVHPRLLFDAAGLAAIRSSSTGALAPVRARLMARADALLTAPPLLVSTTGRGEPDPPGHLKGIEAARRLQGRTATFAIAFLLSGDRRYRDAALAGLDHALEQWPIWVDTAHQPPYDLMTGENSLTYGLAYDWLYDTLAPAERDRLREGVERRSLRGYLNATTREKPMFWFAAAHNWNTVCNGGATVLALALGADSALAEPVLRLSAPAMAPYWDHLAPDGGWDEGTGYWAYGHRYAFIAADALRRAGRPEGQAYLARPGAERTGYFPIIFNPGRTVSASFGDSPGRANDPIFYFLAREYRNPDFAWFQGRTTPPALGREGWPDEAFELIWRAAGADERRTGGTGSAPRPNVPPIGAFPSIGWALLAPAQPDPPFFLAFKNGSLAANHSHLDLNHVSVAVGDTMLLPDLGSRPYPADYFTPARRYAYYEISTAGHNTVLVGGKGQVPGRPGQMLGPTEGSRYTAVVGVADNAYEIATPRARRHVVFVDKRYFVLLDEIETGTAVVATAEPAAPPIELRFHSYGTIAPRSQSGWTVSQAGAAVDIVPAAAVVGRVEAADGWIRPVQVLRLTAARPGPGLLLATAILPRSPGGGAGPSASASQVVDGGEVRVTVGTDVLTFRRGPDGYALSEVTVR